MSSVLRRTYVPIAFTDQAAAAAFEKALGTFLNGSITEAAKTAELPPDEQGSAHEALASNWSRHIDPSGKGKKIGRIGRLIPPPYKVRPNCSAPIVASYIRIGSSNKVDDSLDACIVIDTEFEYTDAELVDIFVSEQHIRTPYQAALQVALGSRTPESCATTFESDPAAAPIRDWLGTLMTACRPNPNTADATYGFSIFCIGHRTEFSRRTELKAALARFLRVSTTERLVNYESNPDVDYYRSYSGVVIVGDRSQRGWLEYHHIVQICSVLELWVQTIFNRVESIDASLDRQILMEDELAKQHLDAADGILALHTKALGANLPGYLKAVEDASRLSLRRKLLISRVEHAGILSDRKIGERDRRFQSSLNVLVSIGVGSAIVAAIYAAVALDPKPIAPIAIAFAGLVVALFWLGPPIYQKRLSDLTLRRTGSNAHPPDNAHPDGRTR